MSKGSDGPIPWFTRKLINCNRCLSYTNAYLLDGCDGRVCVSALLVSRAPLTNVKKDVAPSVWRSWTGRLSGTHAVKVVRVIDLAL
jgi:hypothetical protein